MPSLRNLDLAWIAVCLVLGTIAYHLIWLGTMAGIAGGLAVIVGLLRIVYEFTINRPNIPTIATGGTVRRHIIACLQAELGDKPCTIIDLGSGRGELVRAIGRAMPQAQVTGIELARVPFWQSRLMVRLCGLRNVAHLRQDLFAYDCREADAVVLFLGKLTAAAGAKLRSELKAGALVISHDFFLSPEETQGGWQPVDTIIMRTPFKATLYIYRQN